MARNRSALCSVLAPGATNMDNPVFDLFYNFSVLSNVICKTEDCLATGKLQTD